MGFDMLVGTTSSHMSLLPEVRKCLLLADGKQLHKFLTNAGFHLSARNPPID